MNGLKKGANVLFQIIDRFATVVSTCSLLLLIIMVTAQVILRYANMPLFGIEESEVFPIMWLYAAGALVAAHDRTHISCGLGGVVCKDPAKLALINCFRDLITAVCSVIGIWIVYPHFTYINKVTKTTITMHLPTKFAECAFLIALVLMCLYALRDLCHGVAEWKRIKEEAK